MNLFTDSKLVYEGRKSLLSELEIRQLLEITGDKINSFIQFLSNLRWYSFSKASYDV